MKENREMPTLVAAREELLTEGMLERFDARAPIYDRENRFFSEDLQELRDSGYLSLAVPREFGGSGLKLAEFVALQRKLAYVAPATAIAVNMHIYWTGVAADLYRSGDSSLVWLLEEAGRGKIFAAGHGEAGNDIPVLFSTTRAERVDGGWEFTGHKIFGSLSPVWDYLGLHGMDTSDPFHPRVVHAFLSQDDSGYRIVETWDTLGMRATQSHDTILDRAFVPDERIAVVSPAGFAGAGAFHLGVFVWPLIGFAAVYAGIADRAFDLTVQSLHKKSSIALTRSMAHHPEVQHHVAEMRLALESIDAHLKQVAQDWSDGVDHGANWPVKIIAAKYMAVTKAWHVVDTALDLTGGSGIFTRNRLEQLFRDARLGRIHPSNTLVAHEVVGKLSLGIDPDVRPRWG
jgi:alkylation response protein AidB-like acyl-CoA dehydrogenase